jgi:serine/threonine protein kinase/formylglycine-generating enzyme required for sulfatase activity
MFELCPGDVFAGRYQVERKLAEGGMGTVYVVRHTSTSRRHALKVMLPSLVKSAEQRERFLREATICSIIEDTEHIVEVSDAGVDPATEAPFLVMEFLQGRELAELLQATGPLPPEQALPLLTQLAKALTAAHAKGVVHRDLKPENLFVVERPGKPPTVKVLDFGIAKLVQGAAEATSTLQGGSPLFMAPEQTEARAQIGPRTDVWAFGLIAFTSLVGRTYWLADDLRGVYGELLRGNYESATARARQYGRELPPGFDAFFCMTVAMEADRRVSSAWEALQVLYSAYGKRLEDERSCLPPFAIASNEASPRDGISQSAPRSGTIHNTPSANAFETGSRATQLRGDTQVVTTNTSPQPSRGLGLQLRFGLGGLTAVAVGVGAALWLQAGRNTPAAGSAAGKVRSPASARTSATASAAAPSASTTRAAEGGWRRIEAAAGVVLGTSASAPEDEHGFRPSANVQAPLAPFEIQAREVSWAEFDPWLTQRPGEKVTLPAWLPLIAAERAPYPVIGVSFQLARVYCATVGGDLPTEEQWELAARSTKPQALRGKPPPPIAVHPVDGGCDNGLCGMVDNVREWTRSPFRRADGAPFDKSDDGSSSWVAVRGFPALDPAKALGHEPTAQELSVFSPGQPVLASYRRRICAEGKCPEKSLLARDDIGFRCARPVKETP